MLLYFKTLSCLLFIFTLTSIKSSLLFNIKPQEEKCIIEEFFQDSIFILKYKFFTLYESTLSLQPYFQINIYNLDTDTNIIHEPIKSVKGKRAVQVPKTGLYKICVYLKMPVFKYDWENNLVFFSFKIMSAMAENNEALTKAIKSQDVDVIKTKANEVLKLTKPIIEFQDDQLKSENEGSKETLANTRIYKYMTFGQLTVTIIIGAIQINNFWKFIKSQHII